MSNKASPEICYVNYQKPDFETALKNCQASCKGPDQCQENGWIFYEDYFFKCPVYHKYRDISCIILSYATLTPFLMISSKKG